MTRRLHSLGLALGLSLALFGRAEANPSYSGKISITGFYYTESDGLDLQNNPAVNFPMQIASSSNLGFGELRATVDARRMANERVDFHLDVRLRLTGQFDFENKFNDNADHTTDLSNSLGTSAQGYLGGPEYDLREAYVNIHFTKQIGLQLGRMFVNEADNIKIDGARVWRNFGTHWVGSAFVGGYPNPYSRSLLTDYIGPCGAGVAGDRDGPAVAPCTTEGPKLAMAFGAGARYFYDRLWGSVGFVGSFFTGVNDGGPVQINPAAKPYGGAGVSLDQSNLLDPTAALDAPRVYLSWLNAWRPAERFDLFTDLVFDLYGSSGPQLTRLVLLGTIRILRDDRLTMRIGFSYMSSLAIDMYLNRLVYNRLSGTTLTAMGISAVENNLTILQTGRAEGRVTLDTRIVRRLGAFVEGRVRYRDLMNGASNPTVYTNDTFNSAADAFAANVPNLAGDVSAGLRDNGSLLGIRGSLVYTGIFDYLSTNHVISFDIGREFWRERIGVTLNYVVALTADKQATSMDTCSPVDPYLACFGHRTGATHEAGVTLTLNPWRTLFFIADYRFIALLTDPQPPDQAGATVFPTVLSHAILTRLEFRW